MTKHNIFTLGLPVYLLGEGSEQNPDASKAQTYENW